MEMESMVDGLRLSRGERKLGIGNGERETGIGKRETGGAFGAENGEW